ncbi:MAG TPA: alpha-glucan family phosphorylase [Burkholderiales bacterium]|nr:alpha-glucan family phosphorylase [Burkholderiales bacterium]
MQTEFLTESRIAFFTMEIALRDEIPTYAGGLGILAGDTVRSAADLDVPLVAVSLISRAGYFRQEIDAQGRQLEHDESWSPQRFARPLEAKVAIPIEGREVWVRSWLYVVEGLRRHREPVILLDTDLHENRPEDRRITHQLYGGDDAYRLKQEMVLGIGGVRMLHALGFEIRRYHLNEGHSALLALELLRRFARSAQEAGSGSVYDVPRVRQLCNFTTHTPIEAGHDQFDYDLVQRVMGDVVDIGELKLVAGEQRLNMTRLALTLSEYVNGVSQKHAEVSQRSFPGFRIHAVANGVHASTWTSASFVRLYDARLPSWRYEPELLSRVIDQVPDEVLWEAHQSAKRTLVERVKSVTGVELKLDVPILAFARRMTAYKRPDLLFSDMRRLERIARSAPFQVVMAGKAHPHDQTGKQLIETLSRHGRELAGLIPVVFLPNYGMQIALEAVAGADVWLNTPLRPLEASGTSGMKAAFNGVPSLSVLDGWWIEGCIEGVTGWAIGDSSPLSERNDAEALYSKLESKVLPLYGSGVHAWAPVMKGAIGKNAAYFNSHRMMRRYAIEAYIR